MAAGAPTIQYHLESDDELEQKLCEKGCRVVEIFSEWCGPCKAVLPTFKRIRLDKDDEAVVQFLTIAAEQCNLLEVAKTRRGESEPMFLVYRNGALKQKVEGSNTPDLNKHILELTPNSADADDLEENPLYLARKERLKHAAEAAKQAAKIK